MAELVNLRTMRKRASKKREADRAAENRTRSGMTKAERALRDARRDQALRFLDQRRMQTKDGR